MTRSRHKLDQLAYAHTGFFTSEPAESLADLLIANAPKDIDRVYLVSGGSEATEAAIKLARQYFVEKGQPNRGAPDRAQAELSRQHHRRAIGRRKRMAACPIRSRC